MQCLTRQEAASWLRTHLNLSNVLHTTDSAELRSQLASQGYHADGYQHPPDSGRKACIAKALYSLFDSQTTVFILVDGWQIFPSSGHLPLLNRLRQCLGEMRPVDETPAHLFATAERDDAISIIVLAFEFFWNCLVVGATGEHVLSISHDECFDFLSQDPNAIARFNALVQE